MAATQQLAATQYADDAEAFLLTLAEVPTFMTCMDDFAKASGQRLNPTKTRLLHIGQQPEQAAVPRGAAPVLGDLQVVAKAKSLGVFFDQHGKSSGNWDGRMEIVRHRMQNISRISKLSAFGRAFAANAYALSTLLYAAQFAGHLPAEVTSKLSTWTAALIDAGLGPEDDLRRTPGIPGDCMAAHPTRGGFGCLPVHHHLLSRWALKHCRSCKAVLCLGWQLHGSCGIVGLPLQTCSCVPLVAALGVCCCVAVNTYSLLLLRMCAFPLHYVRLP